MLRNIVVGLVMATVGMSLGVNNSEKVSDGYDTVRNSMQERGVKPEYALGGLALVTVSGFGFARYGIPFVQSKSEKEIRAFEDALIRDVRLPVFGHYSRELCAYHVPNAKELLLGYNKYASRMELAKSFGQKKEFDAVKAEALALVDRIVQATSNVQLKRWKELYSTKSADRVEFFAKHMKSIRDQLTAITMDNFVC